LTFADLNRTAVLVVGDLGGNMQMLRRADGLPAAPSVRNHSREVTALATGRIDDQFVILSGAVDGTVQVWNPVKNTQVGEPYSDPIPRIAR
jgi:WD40 repeat protein